MKFSFTSDISGNFQNSDGYQSMELALDQFVTHNERLFWSFERAMTSIHYNVFLNIFFSLPIFSLLDCIVENTNGHRDPRVAIVALISWRLISNSTMGFGSVKWRPLLSNLKTLWPLNLPDLSYEVKTPLRQSGKYK